MAAGFFSGLAEALSIQILYLGLREITAISSVQLHFSASCNSVGNSFQKASLALGKKIIEKKKAHMSVLNMPFSLLSSNKRDSLVSYLSLSCVNI